MRHANNGIGVEHVTGKKKKDKRIMIIWISFFFVIGFLLFTAFAGDFSLKSFKSIGTKGLTGFSIKSLTDGFNPNNSISFSAEMDTPFLELDQEFEKIEISGNSAGVLSTSNQDFDLFKHGRVFLTLYGYDGDINFNSKEITYLKGKAESMELNGVVVNPQSGRMKVEFEKVFDYESIEFSDDVFIDELDFFSSGKVTLDNGKKIIDIPGEEVFMDNFKGSLVINEDTTNFNGKIEFFETVGTSKISVKKGF